MATLLRREFLVAVLAGLATFAVPLAVLSWTAAPPPEIKIVSGSGRISAYVVNDELRLLALTAVDPREVQALLGRIRRPWQDGPAVLVLSAANDPEASGVWAALQLTDLDQVIVVGLPGAHPTWTAVERHCDAHAIQLDYVPERATVTLDGLLLVLQAGDEDDGGDALLVRAGRLNIAIALDGKFPKGPAGVVISNGEPGLRLKPDALLIRNEPLVQVVPGTTELALGRNGTATLLFDGTGVRVRGGDVRRAATLTAVPR